MMKNNEFIKIVVTFEYLSNYRMELELNWTRACLMSNYAN